MLTRLTPIKACTELETLEVYIAGQIDDLSSLSSCMAQEAEVPCLGMS